MFYKSINLLIYNIIKFILTYQYLCHIIKFLFFIKGKFPKLLRHGFINIQKENTRDVEN